MSNAVAGPSVFSRIKPNDAAKCMALGRRAALMTRDFMKRNKMENLLDPDALLIGMDFALAHMSRDLYLDKLLMINDTDFFLEFVEITKACRKRLDDTFPRGVHLRYARIKS